MTTLNTIIEEENTPDTEWGDVDRYSVDTGLLKRFFKLYKEGRKTGNPQNFIDYFRAEHYLLTEVGKAIISRDTYWKERVRKEVEGKRWRYSESSNVWAEIATGAIRTNGGGGDELANNHNRTCDDILQALDNLK